MTFGLLQVTVGPPVPGRVGKHKEIVTGEEGPLDDMVLVVGVLRQDGLVTRLLVKAPTDGGRLHEKGE